MSKKEALQLFGDRKIRTAWNEEEERWYFSVVDVVAVLTDSSNPSDYLKKLRSRDPELSKGWGQIVTPLPMKTPGGTQNVNCSDQEGIFRIIQSIPSPKAEPFKLWMAKVASERVDEIQDPELAIDRGYEYYRRLGYSEAWINERMKGKEARKALTDEWQRTGVSGQQYASLTDIITKEWSGMTTKQYKNYKGLKKENLRDHMTRTESVLNTLAEVATTELSQKEDPNGYKEQTVVAKKGGNVAATARKALEKQLGRSVITKQNAKSLKSRKAPKELGNVN
ncbi:MAG: Bro-N domain-containing protein [Bacteroidales bacterium]|nr:Bro-N domain-containing protein [Bacteroidales bacterium]